MNGATDGAWGLIAALAAGLVISACGGEEPGGEQAGASGFTGKVAADAVQVLGTSDRITRVLDMVPADDGRVWVLNSASPYFVVFGSDGQVERAFGVQGGGPDEFGFPVRIVSGPGVEVWTYDVTRHSLIRVSGEERRVHALPQKTLPMPALLSFENGGRPGPPWMEGNNGDFLIARVGSPNVPSGPLRLWDGDIYRLRSDTSGLMADVNFPPIADLLGDPASRYPGATTFGPYPLWTVCGDGLVVLYDPLRNQVRRIRSGGQELEPFDLPDERQVPLNADRLFGMIYRQMREDTPAGQRPDSAEARQQFEGQLREFQRQSAGVFPEYADLRCSSDGALWIQPFDVETGLFGRGPAWLTFGEDGTQTAVEFPEGFRVFAFRTDRVWGTSEDELGVASVAWIGRDALR